jgi:hypothetical protein
MRRISPDWRFIREILQEIATPQHAPIAGIEAQQVAHGAQGEDSTAGHEGRGARAGGIRNPVRTVLGVFPNPGAGARVEAQHPFISRDDWSRTFAGFALRRFALQAIEQVEPVSHDCGTRVTAVDIRAPEDGRAAGRERFDDAGLAPDSVALRTHPLGPVVGAASQADGDGGNGDRRQGSGSPGRANGFHKKFQ